MKMIIKCAVCGRIFRDKGELMRHLSKVHNKKGLEDGITVPMDDKIVEKMM